MSPAPDAGSPPVLPPPLGPPPLGTMAPEGPKMSEVGRLVGVFISPGEAFKDIVRRPRWWVPVLLGIVVSIAYFYAISERIGWPEVVRSQLDRTPAGRNMTGPQREAAIALQERIFPYIMYIGTPIGSVLTLVLIAGMLKFLADVILGAGIGFKRLLGIAAYGFLPFTLMTALSIAVLYMTPPDEFDMTNPLIFNLGALVDSPAWLVALGASFDLFTFWTMLLLSIGMAAASRKMSTGKAFGMLLFPWALVVILRVGSASMVR